MTHEFIASVATMGNQATVIPLTYICRHSFGPVFTLEQIRGYLDNEDTDICHGQIICCSKCSSGFLQE